jgi:GT2 family glycosyltransferase
VKIAFLQPHLRESEAVRHALELGNRLAGSGHRVVHLLPEGEARRCGWMACRGRIDTIEGAYGQPFDALVLTDLSQWHLLGRFARAELTVHYLWRPAAPVEAPGELESHLHPVDVRVASSAAAAARAGEPSGAGPVVLGTRDPAHDLVQLLSDHLETRRSLTLAIDRGVEDPVLEGRRRSRAAQVATYTRPLPLPPERTAVGGSLLSIVTLSWDQLAYTRRFVDSVRAHTGVPYELIIVDNGSQPEARRYVEEAADVCLLNPQNAGFARGMNQGARRAKGDALVFVNNDTVVPPGWAESLLEAASLVERPGIVAPAVTAGGSFVTVRSEAHPVVREILPFSLPPAAVCYLVPRDAFEEAGGWSEEYHLGGAEDVDLCFTMWSRGRQVLVDERVLLEHRSKATTAAKLGDWRTIWKQNRELFIERWSAPEPLLEAEDPRLVRLIEELQSAAGDPAGVTRIAAELTEWSATQRAERAARRAALAAGVARSWREAARQRHLAEVLRRELHGGRLRRLAKQVGRLLSRR